MKNNYTQTEKKNWNALYSSHYTSSNHVTKPAWEPINTLAELLKQITPLTLNSDQDRISPYNISTIPTRYVMRIKKI